MSLVDPYLKTTRAKKHLEDLRDELKRFYESKPCRFIGEDDVENKLYVIRIEISDAPNEVWLIAGDIFCNLRASLDQLVWYLAKSTFPYPEGTYFPILEKRDARRFRSQTRGVPAEAVRIIESLQPYNAQDEAAIHSHLLWRLNKLCVIDKHRRIPVHGSTGTIVWDTPPGGILASGFDDDKIMKIPLDLKGKMALNPRVPEFKVVFGDSYEGAVCDFGDIEAIYEFVTNRVIPSFSGFVK